jgi:adenosylcobinamide-GDP ribazoletransferase
MRPLLRALGFLSVLPLGRLAHFEKENIPAALAAFPLAGALLGALLGLAWHGAAIIFPEHIAAAALVLAWVLLTRAFHLDGLADCADGLGGGYAQERRLQIMKDPHIGVFGAAAIMCALLLKAACLLDLKPLQPLVLMPLCPVVLQRVLTLAMVLSAARFTVLIGACGARYARAPEPGLGREFIVAARVWVVLAGCLAPVMLAFVLGGAVAWVVLAGVVLAALLLRFVFARAIGGQTGDTLGATVEVGEAVALLILCARPPGVFSWN